MVTVWFTRVWPIAVTIALFVAVSGAVFVLARSHYLPSNTQFWVIPGPSGAVLLGVTEPQDLAARANASLAGLVLGACLNSAFLVVLASVGAAIVGIPLGFWLAIHAPPRVAGLLQSITNAGVALPAFFMAFLLQVAVVELSRTAGQTVLPTFGFGLDGHLVIPVVALLAAPLAFITRIVALGATELNSRDFVRTARAKGLGEARVVYGHIAPNMVGALSEATLGGVRLVLAGLVIVEYLVSWPGLGFLLLRAIRAQDGAVLLLGIAIVGSLFLALERGIDMATARTGVVTG